MESCIFCKIVKGEIPSAIVYEDENTMAFMTIEAINEGHVLVIPKTHVTHVHELDEALYTQVMLLVRKLSHAVETAFHAKKIGTIVSGWEVPHAHVQVVPMRIPSDIASKKLLDGEGLHPSMDERKNHAEKIKLQLD